MPISKKRQKQMCIWREKNKDKIREYMKLYVAKNQEKVRAVQKAWRDRHPNYWKVLVQFDSPERMAQKRADSKRHYWRRKVQEAELLEQLKEEKG